MNIFRDDQWKTPPVFDLAWPGMKSMILRETKELPLTFERGFDKLTVRSGKHAIDVSDADIRAAIENDRYDILDNAVKNAVMYLRVMSNGNAKKALAFRTKRRGILARRGAC